jgi:hypothetical protein
MCSESEECVEYRECRTQWYTGYSGSTVQSRSRTLSALVPPSNRSRVMHHDSSSSLLRITDHALPAPNSASGIPHLAATQTCSSTLRHSQPFTSLCPCRLCVCVAVVLAWKYLQINELHQLADLDRYRSCQLVVVQEPTRKGEEGGGPCVSVASNTHTATRVRELL